MYIYKMTKDMSVSLYILPIVRYVHICYTVLVRNKRTHKVR